MDKYIVTRKRKREGTEEEKVQEPELKREKKERESISSFKDIEKIISKENSWFEFFQKEFEKDYFKSLKKFLVEEEAGGKTIYPPPNDVFSIFEHCPLDKIKVVILGQDPYHEKGQANGMCFSVKKGVKVPPSLRNIYKELVTDIPGFTDPGHGDLTGWADQGVFLLNDSLTVLEGNAGSHQGKGWEIFTSAVVNHINQNKKNVVFILWGNHAKKKGKGIDKKKHFVITAAHPSPLSVKKFLGTKCFSKCNIYLKENKMKEINWKSL